MNLQDMLEAIEQTPADGGRVRARAVLDEVGGRTFGPVVLLAGLITLAPIIGDVPGVPTLIGVLTALASLQLLAGRTTFWLPRWVLERTVEQGKLRRAARRMQRPARWVDALIKPRLPVLVEGRAQRLIAVSCLLIALQMPFMELIPFSANLAGAGLTVFGLALVGRDGLLALIAHLLTGAVTVVLVLNLF